MELLSHLRPGDVLGQVDLASYIGAMAKGVAEAQRALDDNTIGLLGQFTEKIDALAGKSLLSLGLSPAFYHFRSATISASVSMSIRVRQEIDVSIHVEAGKSQDSTTKVMSGSKATTSASQTIHLSASQKIEAAQSGNAMQKIDSYSAENSAQSEHFVVAERSAVTNAAQFSASGLARYDASAALFVVPPAGKHWAVLRFTGGSAQGETFAIESAANAYPGTPAPTAKALAEGVAAHAADFFVALLSPIDDPNDLSVVKFDTGSHVVKTVAGQDYAARLRALAHIIAAAGVTKVELVGHTDGVGPKAYNKRLSLLRAQAVAAVLRANGVPATITVEGVGEIEAADNIPDQDARNVTITLTPALTPYFVFVCEETGTLSSAITPSAGSGNGWADAGAYSALGTVSGVAGTLTSASQVATELHDSGQIEASDIGELVYLTNKEDGTTKIANVTVYASESSSLNSSSASDLTFDQAVSSNTAAAAFSETEINRAVAIAGSVDARFARMFDVSMAGNMSIAAELVSIPAPPEFLQFIKDYLED